MSKHSESCLYLLGRSEEEETEVEKIDRIVRQVQAEEDARVEHLKEMNEMARGKGWPAFTDDGYRPKIITQPLKIVHPDPCIPAEDVAIACQSSFPTLAEQDTEPNQ